MLRTLGVLNAAIWFGSAVFLTFFAGPAFFSEGMIRLLTKPYAGAAAQIVLERYFMLQLICGGLALGHLVAESIYLGRPLIRWSLSLLAALFILGLVGGQGIQPKLQALHRTIYAASVPEPTKIAAQRSFQIWHGVSQVLNLVMLVGVGVYLVRISRQGDASRYRTW